MAITKEEFEEVYTDGEYNINVRTLSIIKEDGVEISSGSTRKLLVPSDDYSMHSSKVKTVCDALFTDELKAKYLENFESIALPTLKGQREDSDNPDYGYPVQTPRGVPDNEDTR
jgi:hypothetical protein